MFSGLLAHAARIPVTSTLTIIFFMIASFEPGRGLASWADKSCHGIKHSAKKFDLKFTQLVTDTDTAIGSYGANA